MLRVRLFDSNPYDEEFTFHIQLFGITSDKQSVCLVIDDFKPHFYIKIYDGLQVGTFIDDLKQRAKVHCIHYEIIHRKTLDGFDNGKLHNFVMAKFDNMTSFRRVMDLWYTKTSDGEKILNACGFRQTFLYEANIPPLLRFFHINKISPTGWIEVDPANMFRYGAKKTSCDKEFTVASTNIIPLNDCCDLAPFKICSFDIEAGSSHGDFPVPVKSYKKLAIQLVDKPSSCVRNVIYQAFGGDAYYSDVDLVYPKRPISLKTVEQCIEQLLLLKCNDHRSRSEMKTIETYFESQRITEDSDDEYGGGKHKFEKLMASDQNIVHLLDNQTISRDMKVIKVTELLDSVFPPLEGDPVTFIGSTFKTFGEKEPYLNHCVVLGTCDDPQKPKTEIVCYPSEKEVLLAWTQIIQRENPDIIIGYNIFGFDYSFMFYRAKENSCLESFLKLSRNIDQVCCQNFKGGFSLDETISMLASGQHELKYIKMSGRVQIDLYNVYRRDENLPSYKLDYVSGHFIGDYITEVREKTQLVTKNITGLTIDSYVQLGSEKYQVVDIKDSFFVIDRPLVDASCNRWALAKDDVTPQDIFRMSKESDAARYIIAKYCLQDCNLLHHLMTKTDLLTGFIEMSAICSVPISFLVLRGQGIKLTSYVAKKCAEKETLMKVLGEPVMNDEGYEGATVLDPKCNLYLDNPVACVDYASLYPSSMISENLSHDSKVWTKEFDLDGNLLHAPPDESYDNLPGVYYVNITYDTFRYERKSATSKAEKIRCGYKVCRFAQVANAIMPAILKELLEARKSTRQRIKRESDEFMKNVLDKRQLGYKVTANSLYGQCGAKTSTFYDKDIAASTTRTGRSLLIYAKSVIESVYQNRACTLSDGSTVMTNAEYIYGDTDSVFFTFNLSDKGLPVRGKRALEITIELAQEASHIASKFLKAPHDLEYEKTFMPFCLLSKKRYVGMLYELDPTKCKRKEMGIVLKRRDNAPIVKDIYGGVIDILMKNQDIVKSVDFLKTCLQDIIDQKCPMSKLIISKSLRSDYKNPKQIAHKVLADRITVRDPGNKPNPGDRIPYVYIVTHDASKLQGEKIETPTFILENALKIDYGFYITNQIMKPVQQLFSLVIEDLWRLTKKPAKLKQFLKKTAGIRDDPKQLEKLRNEEVKILLFDPFLQDAKNKKDSNQSIQRFFQPSCKV